MSTNANIMILNKDGSADGITCHWDGYLSHVGRILNDYYQDESKVRKLINLGDVSILGKTTEASPFVKDFGFDWSYSNTYNKICRLKGQKSIKFAQDIFEVNQDYTTAYHRDRGEKKSITHYKDLNDIQLDECNYLYNPNKIANKWYCFAGDDSDDDVAMPLDFNDRMSWYNLNNELKEQSKQ